MLHDLAKVIIFATYVKIMYVVGKPSQRVTEMCENRLKLIF